LGGNTVNTGDRAKILSLITLLKSLQTGWYLRVDADWFTANTMPHDSHFWEFQG
jgi:hypothetical protein